MELSGKSVLVTGGAGLIGTHLTESLAADNDVLVADNCSKGNREWVPESAAFAECDLTDPDDVAEVVTGDLDVIFHLGALSDVNRGDHRRVFEHNNAMLYNILERMDEVGLSKIAFASSSAVYGEAPRPTPEDFAPLEPVSTYGASKLAGEGLLSTYAHSHDFTTWLFRFSNVVGPHQRNNVISDFIEKLLDDPHSLEILGDGRQEKSYLHVEDCVAGMEHVVENTDDPTNIYNLGTRTTISVTRIAELVSDVVGCDPEYEYTGGDRGWTGDVPKMRLSIEKASAIGWSPERESAQAVRTAAEQLYDELA
ncbi:NAD-dependent epimerase/dehydratase family protein [Halorussus pelagicus]|uniref:NAD-dependent epimerase/dehydratase family protein n=1 Tax=Halorussus pelagicus TaxID=2505977 RepID=UPI000FFC231E|nr:NAD-dependent epimerase/dehydratase family protein [Halorussus pelagicus]